MLETLRTGAITDQGTAQPPSMASQFEDGVRDLVRTWIDEVDEAFATAATQDDGPVANKRDGADLEDIKTTPTNLISKHVAMNSSNGNANVLSTQLLQHMAQTIHTQNELVASFSRQTHAVCRRFWT